MDKPDEYRITMLGEFTISYKDKRIYDQSNRSKKPWNMLEYIVANRGRDITQDELTELLWPDGSSDNPVGALKVLLHRVRKSLEIIMPENGEEIIVLKRGLYKWNPNLASSVDTDDFEKLCMRAADTSLPSSERIRLYCQAFSIYKGDFLSRNGHSPWVVPVASYYHMMYINSVYDAVSLLTLEGHFSEVEMLTRHALEIDPVNEKLYYLQIEALYKSGRQQEALKKYSDVTDLFYKKFGINPSDELKALYRVIAKTTKTLETDIGIIKETLREQGEAVGAFFCEYEIFKYIYQLQARASARTGDSIYLCLVTVSTDNGETPAIKILNKAMEDLRQTIKSTLRRGDAASRYSVSQYVLLLPAASYENVEMIMKRVISSFFCKYVKKDITLQYKLHPLDPS